MEIPEGFTESPYVLPAMACPLCACRFAFKEPFEDCTRITCPKCRQIIDVPDQIIEQFLDNIEFREFIKKRTPRQ